MDIYNMIPMGGTCYFADKNALKGTLLENIQHYRCGKDSFQRGGRSANWMVLHGIVCMISNIFWHTTEQIKLMMENLSQTHADSRGAACVGEDRRGDQVEGIIERAQEVGG